MASAKTAGRVSADDAGAGAGTGTKLCAPSCGRESVQVIPGVPDPGTLDARNATVALLPAVGSVALILDGHPDHVATPVVPPPRA
jgi:hypothetical protein